MKLKKKITLVALFSLICLIGASPGLSGAEDYASLKGLKSIKAVFDFRNGVPNSALIHLKLVQMIHEDKAILKITDKPELVVVFMGKSVKLLSKNREGFSPKENKMLDEMAGLISKLSKGGVRLEVCGFALNSLKVDPKSVPSELHHVYNGWISTIGYQAKGYSLVPAF